jgi:hypothetical protein
MNATDDAEDQERAEANAERGREQRDDVERRQAGQSRDERDDERLLSPLLDLRAGLRDLPAEPRVLAGLRGAARHLPQDDLRDHLSDRDEQRERDGRPDLPGEEHHRDEEDLAIDDRHQARQHANHERAGIDTEGGDDAVEQRSHRTPGRLRWQV